MRSSNLISIVVGLAVLVLTSAASAQSRGEYIQFKPRQVKGALYKPDKGPAPRVAFFVMHRTSNYLGHYSLSYLVERGFMVLAMNPRFDNNEGKVDFEKILYDLRQGMEFLRKQKGIEKVILYANSGGGPTMSLYQAVAENGAAYCRGKNKITNCKEDVAGLIKGDGIVFVDAHPGNTVNRLRSFNPAVIDEANPAKLDPSLDPFNPANGFNPKGASKYSEEFKKRYFEAQSARMNRLIDKAQKIRADMKAGKHFPRDNDSFVQYRRRARLMELDPTIHGSTKKPRKLLKNDGTIDASSIVTTVRQPRPENAKRDKTFGRAAVHGTIKSFLSATAIRSTNSMDGVDWCSSNNSTPCAIQHVTVPVLFGAMQGHYFMRDNEIHYEMAKSKDKDLIIVEGATHLVDTCKKCAKATGKDYSNARKNFFDYVAAWTNARF